MAAPQDAKPPESPYAPPRAAVADVGGPPPQRPALVTRAVRCLWTVFTIGIVSTLWKLAMPSPGLKTLGSGGSGVPEMMALIMSAVIFLLSAWLYHAIGKGRNWARIVYLIFACLSVLSLPYIFMSFKVGALSGLETLLSLVNFGISFYVIYLLLTKPAREWFQQIRERA